MNNNTKKYFITVKSFFYICLIIVALNICDVTLFENSIGALDSKPTFCASEGSYIEDGDGYPEDALNWIGIDRAFTERP